MEPNALIAKTSVNIFKAAAPTMVDRAKSLLIGKQILVLGQQRAGKTSFVDFLKTGLLSPEMDTPPTTDPEKTSFIKLKLIPNEVEIQIKSVTEIPGQRFASDHARLLLEKKPDLAVIVLDMSTDEITVWIKSFLETTRTLFLEKPQKLPPIIVLLNKVDLATAEEIEKIRNIIKHLIVTRITESMGCKGHSVHQLESILVEHPESSSYNKSIMAALAHILGRL